MPERMATMRGVWTRLVLLILVGGWPGFACAAPTVTATFRAPYLSVTAEEASLKDVLSAISRVTGISISMDVARSASFERQLPTISFRALEIEEVLRRLLRHRDVVLVYSAGGLDEVRIYEGGATSGRLALEWPEREPSPPSRPVKPPKASDTEDLAELRALALGRGDADQRADALLKLWSSTDKDAARETALELLRRERAPDVLGAVLEVLKEAGSLPIEPILGVAGLRQSSELRIQAMELFMERGRRDSRVTSLIKAAARDPDAEVQSTAQKLLEDINRE